MRTSSIIKFLESVEVFSSFNPNELKYLAIHAQSSQYDFGTAILKAGDPGQGLCLVKSGKVRLFTESEGKEKSFGIRGPGDTFNEISALKETLTEYSVRSSAKTEILFFSREVIMDLLNRNETARHFMTRYVALKVTGGFVTHFFNLRSKVSRTEIQSIIEELGVRRVQAGQEILSQDSAEDRSLYIVRHGEINIVREEEGTTYPLKVLGSGEIFGEKACLKYSVQQASAIAKTDAVLMVVPQKQFILL